MVHIYIDSTAALNYLNNSNPTPRQWIVRKIVEAGSMLQYLGYQVEFHWVPSHMEVKGNKISDKTAKDVASYPVQQTPNNYHQINTSCHYPTSTDIPKKKATRKGDDGY
jgi:ribonuclease HI